MSYKGKNAVSAYLAKFESRPQTGFMSSVLSQNLVLMLNFAPFWRVLIEKLEPLINLIIELSVTHRESAITAAPTVVTDCFQF